MPGCTTMACPLSPSLFSDYSSVCTGVGPSAVIDHNSNNLVPTPHDVLLGRGKSNNHHPGNVRFNELIRSRCNTYYQTLNPVGRKQIISETIDRIKEHGGRFLKRENQQWIVVTWEKAHLKVAHAIQHMARRRINEFVEKRHVSTEMVGSNTHLLSQVPPPSLSIFPQPTTFQRPAKGSYLKQRKCVSLSSRLPVSSYSAFSNDFDGDRYANMLSSTYDRGPVSPIPLLSASYPPQRIHSCDSDMTDFVEPQPTAIRSIATTHPINKKPDSTKQQDSCLVKPESTCSSDTLFEAPLKKRRLRSSTTSIGSFDLEEMDASFADLDW